VTRDMQKVILKMKSLSDAEPTRGEDSSDSDSINMTKNMKKKQNTLCRSSKFLTTNSNLISAFFIIYLVVFSIILVKYVPSTYIVLRDHQLSEVKFKIHYMFEYFSNQRISQFLLAFSQIIFALIIYNLASLIKQRISVPEFNSDKGKFYVLIISLLSECLSCMGLIFWNDYFLHISRHYLNLTDNILSICLITSIFSICATTYFLLLRMDIAGSPKEGYYINMKYYVLTLMGISLFHYIACLLLSSYYKPVIYIEKALLGFVILCKELNFIVFFFCYLTFVITMKYDFYYMYLNLCVRPDIEFFVDNDEESATLLKK